mmetsp:Transcript_28120/g.67732  ORF Transcript_28120/g.67732 Transcript_28120/m.67732 type:complete len:226 (-) Transcript_28120:661-1338(-)
MAAKILVPSILPMVLALILCVSFAPLRAAAWTPPPPLSSPEVSTSRNYFLRRMLTDVVPSSAALLLVTSSSRPALAAPPFAIMAEEMGYFPVNDERTGETVMVPARAKRESTSQAVSLAKHLRDTGAVMYGAYWCPHCSRQKELFGREAWKYVRYVECSPKGYQSGYATCLERGVDGYPSWEFGNGKSQGGEMELVDIAKLSGYSRTFKASLETGVPPLGGGSCQ